MTIKQIHEGLKKKEFSALELCKEYLAGIKEKDEKIHSFLTVSEELAISQAKKVDDRLFKKREIPLLAGVPFAVKDNILVEGLPCTAGSKMLENYTAPYNATVIEKLKKQGAVILGKTNLDEFALGSSTENSAFGCTRNPHDLTRVPGGSSGGSAAAVAADLSVFSLGSDTGGSIREPASFCGVVGLKPTYGAVSRYGLIAFASSLDQIGPITKTVEDCQIVFDAIKGKDPLDSTSVEAKIENCKLKIENLRIGLPREYFDKKLDDPEMEKVVEGAIKKYEQMGAKLVEVRLPHTEYALKAYYIIAPAELSANLARFDGIRYGFSAKDSPHKSLSDVYLENRGKGLGSESKRRIMVGTFVLSSGYYEAYYLKAQKVISLIKKDFEDVFRKVDVIFSPVSPVLPFKIGERIENPLLMYLVDIYTDSTNLVGLPALSVPAGSVAPHHFDKKPDKQSQIKKTENSEGQSGGGLPVGLQIIGKRFEEDKILEIAKWISIK